MASKLETRERRLDCFVASTPRNDGSAGKDRTQNKNEQAIRVSPNRLLVEDLTAIGYPRPAPSLTASDPVFFEGRTAGTANRSVAKSGLFTFVPVCAMKRRRSIPEHLPETTPHEP
jgi:hypothetical protein